MIEAYNAEIGDLVGIIMPADFQCKGRNLPIDFCLKRIIDPPNRRRWREGACQKFVLIVDDPKLVKYLGGGGRGVVWPSLLKLCRFVGKLLPKYSKNCLWIQIALPS
ncbi:hypothetical protein SCA6_000454 [Theobroma cacao]